MSTQIQISRNNILCLHQKYRNTGKIKPVEHQLVSINTVEMSGSFRHLVHRNIKYIYFLFCLEENQPTLSSRKFCIVLKQDSQGTKPLPTRKSRGSGFTSLARKGLEAALGTTPEEGGTGKKTGGIKRGDTEWRGFFLNM